MDTIGLQVFESCQIAHSLQVHPVLLTPPGNRIYPDKLPSSQFLNYYASRLNAVEVNYTYRRIAAATTFEKWLAATPAGFVVLPKAHMKITHSLKLKDAEEFTRYFLQSLEPLRVAGRLDPFCFSCRRI